jgi:GNAT superfamily N-acetyltransferase
MNTPYAIRRATLRDLDQLEALIEQSARKVGTKCYTAVQLEAALRGAFGVDTQLINDGTYFVVESDDGSIVGCGGWSRRRTLFGGDNRMDRQTDELDPRTDGARIRAFFVDPQHLRRGIASALLAHCEAEALAAGFLKLELMATLTGVPLYRARGYVATASVSYEGAPGVSIPFLAMAKDCADKA